MSLKGGGGGGGGGGGVSLSLINDYGVCYTKGWGSHVLGNGSFIAKEVPYRTYIHSIATVRFGTNISSDISYMFMYIHSTTTST